MSIHWPLQTPVDCWVIHFVYKYNQMLYSSSFGQHGMLSRLASFLKACFKLSFPCRDYLQREKVTINTGTEVNGKTKNKLFCFLSDSQCLLSLTSVFKQRPLLYHDHVALLIAQVFPWIFWIVDVAWVDISQGSPSVPIQHYDSPALPNQPVKHHQSCWAQSFCGLVRPEW